MLQQLGKLTYVVEELRHKSYDTEYKLDRLDFRLRPVEEILQAMIEATEDLYQLRLEEIAPYIKKITLAQLESVRFMTEEQYEAFWRRQLENEY